MIKKLLTSGFTNKIYLCNAKQTGKANVFEAVGKKEDFTDEAIGAVYQWFLNHCEKEESGMYQIRYGDKPWLTMEIEENKSDIMGK